MIAVPDATDWSELSDAVRQLALEYAEARRRSDPAWIYVQQPRDGELQYATFRSLPEYHFRAAFDRLKKQSEMGPDGGYDTLHNGPRRATVYYWLNPETGAALAHTGVNDEETIPFFRDGAAARTYLETRAATGDHDQFDGLSLYKARTRKVVDAVDVLTDQAGFDEFAPDGGLQIDDPDRDCIWFWYNPSLDSIVQEEVALYDIRGLFNSEDDAYRFLDWYADHYGVVDTSQLELYRAEVSLEGFGRRHFTEESDRSEDPPEQVDIDAFRDEDDSE